MTETYSVAALWLDLALLATLLSNTDFGVADGHPAEQMLYRTDEIHADQIVPGHRGKNFVERRLLGRVGHRVIAYATTVVTVVR